ncbi:MAG TPA: DUF2975 domain-containing protein [Chthoniobacterales bacterium]
MKVHTQELPLRRIRASLTAARVALRILIVLNWVYGAIIFAILVGMFTAPHWTMTAIGLHPSVESGSLMIQGLRMIPVLGLVGVPLNFIVLSRLLAIVRTVRAGDPFVAQNAARLQVIAWAVLGQQLLQLAIGSIAHAVSTPAHSLRISVFSPSGWLAVLLLFVLARVFAEGARMREELEGTV